MNRKREKQFETDVLVAGGGIAGISAALSAARGGARVLLVEKQCLLGGLATLGLIAIYLPLCDGNGHQMAYGIAEELLRLAVSEGGEKKAIQAWLQNGSIGERKAHRFEAQFNPQMMALLAEEVLLKNGVQILFDTCITNLKVENGKITEAGLTNKYETGTVKAKSYIDATGDADLFWMAGCETRTFQKKNKLASWYYRAGKQGVSLRILGESDSMTEEGKQEEDFLPGSRYSGLDGEENTEFLCAAHKAILTDVRIHRQQDHSYELVTVPGIPQMRMTRRFCGKYELKIHEMGTAFEDSIGMTGDWRKAGPVYEIPFRCLYAEKTKNLAGAGRCISVDDDMWDITRVIPCCAVTGEAAGTAAAMSDDFARMDIGKLQDSLCRRGQKIHLKETALYEKENV